MRIMPRQRKNKVKLPTFITRYHTPEGLDDLWLASDGEVLTGVWFVSSRDEGKHAADFVEKDLPIFREAGAWLDAYFAGDLSARKVPRYRLENVTAFRQAVSDEMMKIPLGARVTYGEIGKRIAVERGVERISAQAVGGAVGWNPICILIPCHRVVGAGGAMVGYGGGLKNKVALLAHEEKILQRRDK